MWATVHSKHPRAIVCHVAWGGKVLRCLLDTGCTFECVVDSNLSLDPNEVVSAQSKHILVKGLGGVQNKQTLYWINQGLSVQGTRVNVKTVTQCDLRHLEYDMILGLPFLQRLNPKLCWRTGRLTFEKFSWHQEPELLENAGIHAVCTVAELEEQLRNPTKYVGTEDEVEDLIFARMIDVVGALEEEGDHPINSGKFDVPGVPPEKQHSVLNPELEDVQKRQMLELLKQFNANLSDKHNLPHAETGFQNQPKDWAFRIPSKEGVDPPMHEPRHMSPAEKAECKRQLQWFVSHGFLKPRASPWASPVSHLYAKRTRACACA